jgi:hypothetical protein
MLLKVEEYILLAKLRAILRKEEEKPEEERDQQFIPSDLIETSPLREWRQCRCWH